MSDGGPFFGIDLGTTNSSMAWCDPDTGRAEVIYNSDGEPKTPSVVYFGEDEDLVGKDAEEKVRECANSHDPEERHAVNRRVVRSIKRNLLLPPVIPIPGARKPVKPLEVVAHILGKLKRDAEEGHFYEEIERVVITCPATFGMQERQVVLEAAAKVGFRRVELLEEPSAAALTVTRKAQKVGQGVLVYDLGAGTFDLSVMVREPDGAFRVAMDPDGDPRCGGDDFDHALYEHCEEVARRDLGRSISPTGDVDLFFLRDCRARKENLSTGKTSVFSSLLVSEDGARQFKHRVDRDAFEARIRPRIRSTVERTAALWKRAVERGYEMDTLVLIGGSSRVPLVKELLSAAVPVEPRDFAGKDFAVALGAAYHAHDLWGEAGQEAKEYRRAVELAWNDRRLTRAEAEWLSGLE